MRLQTRSDQRSVRLLFNPPFTIASVNSETRSPYICL
nr:MAG TPA: hypothetical protein [Caudoviricetes sp.]